MSSQLPDNPAPATDWFVRNHLKLRHLSIVVALDDTRSVGRTAELLHTSQPAISKAMADIEAAAGVRLFERRARGTFPTPAGAALIRHAREIFGSLKRAGREVAAIANGLDGDLAVGCNHTSSAWLLPHSVIAMKARAPHVNISVREGVIDTLLPELRANRLDIVIARRPTSMEPGEWKVEELFDEPMGVVCSVNHPLARRKRLDWAALSRWPWIMAHEGTLVRRGLEAILREHHVVAMEAGIECTSILAVPHMLSSLNALTLLPTQVTRLHGLASRLVVLPVPLASVFGTNCAITRFNREASPALDMYLNCLREIKESMADTSPSQTASRSANRA